MLLFITLLPQYILAAIDYVPLLISTWDAIADMTPSGIIIGPLWTVTTLVLVPWLTWPYSLSFFSNVALLKMLYFYQNEVYGYINNKVFTERERTATGLFLALNVLASLDLKNVISIGNIIWRAMELAFCTFLSLFYIRIRKAVDKHTRSGPSFPKLPNLDFDYKFLAPIGILALYYASWT